VLPGLEALAP